MWKTLGDEAEKNILHRSQQPKILLTLALFYNEKCILTWLANPSNPIGAEGTTAT